LQALRDVALPLQPADRSTFLQSVATRLAGIAEPGDGEVWRAARDAAQEVRWSRLRLAPEPTLIRSSQAHRIALGARLGAVPMAWLLLQGFAGAEFIVERQLGELLGITAYIPRKQKTVKPRHVRGTRVVVSPLFPRFVFASTPRETAVLVRRHIREAAIRAVPVRLRNETEYLFVPDRDIDALRVREAAGEFMYGIGYGSLRVEFKVGSLVLIGEGGGHFAGHRGTVRGYHGRNRVKVALNGLDLTVGCEHLTVVEPEDNR
jgi:hypothetical protein